jgi:hypothetical protein
LDLADDDIVAWLADQVERLPIDFLVKCTLECLQNSGQDLAQLMVRVKGFQKKDTRSAKVFEVQLRGSPFETNIYQMSNFEWFSGEALDRLIESLRKDDEKGALSAVGNCHSVTIREVVVRGVAMTCWNRCNVELVELAISLDAPRCFEALLAIITWWLRRRECLARAALKWSGTAEMTSEMRKLNTEDFGGYLPGIVWNDGKFVAGDLDDLSPAVLTEPISSDKPPRNVREWLVRVGNSFPSTRRSLLGFGAKRFPPKIVSAAAATNLRGERFLIKCFISSISHNKPSDWEIWDSVFWQMSDMMKRGLLSQSVHALL